MDADDSAARASYGFREMFRAAVILAFGLATAGAVVVGTGSGAEAQASRVFDRTYRCAVGVDGGIRSVTVWAQTGIRDLDDRTKWQTPPYFQLNPSPTGSAVRVWAGPAVSEPNATSWADTFFFSGCARAPSPVQLTPRGLSGGRASQFIDRYQCSAPRTVFVRVRVEFVRRVTVGRATRVPVSAGQLAVRAAAGKPIAHADVRESGRARIFAAPNCVPE